MPSNKSVEKALAMVKKDPSKVLGLSIGGHVIKEPGEYVPKADAQQPPQITFPSASPSKTYLVIGLDLDAPFTFWSGLGPILHWVQPGLRLSSSTPSSPNESQGVLEIDPSAPFIANYIGPAPPPIGGPHRYVFFLYEQPADEEDGFEKKRKAVTPNKGKKMGNGARMWASLDEWEGKLGLGSVVGVGWFTSN